MRSRSRDQHEASPAPPRKDLLGFTRSVVDFFTGVTGMAAAALSIVGTVVAFTLAGWAPEDDGGVPAGVRTETPVATPTLPTDDSRTTPTPSRTTVVSDEYASAVNEMCARAATAMALGAAESEDVTSFSAAISTLAHEVRGAPTPAGFQADVASAADDFERTAQAAAAGDLDGFERHSDNASNTLAAIGVDGC